MKRIAYEEINHKNCPFMEYNTIIRADKSKSVAIKKCIEEQIFQKRSVCCMYNITV